MDRNSAGRFAVSTTALTHGSIPGWTPQFASALQRLAIPHRQRARGLRYGDVRAAARGRALEFADHRPYLPGDEPRLVDWRAYARSGRLFLKQYEEERARTVTILLDVSASMNWGDEDEAGSDTHKGRYARKLAAAIIWIAVSRHDTVAVYLLREGRSHRLPLVQGATGAGACFRYLAAAVEEGRTGLASAVREALATVPRGPTLLVSDFLEAGWPEALGEISSSGEATAIQILAPTEWSPPLGEEVELLDAENGDTLITRLGTRELSEYAVRLEEFLTSIEAECGRLGVAHVALNSATQLQDTLFRKLPAAGILE
jgi:uncharacterized protein (DUF58 family)